MKCLCRGGGRGAGAERLLAEAAEPEEKPRSLGLPVLPGGQRRAGPGMIEEFSGHDFAHWCRNVKINRKVILIREQIKVCEL